MPGVSDQLPDLVAPPQRILRQNIRIILTKTLYPEIRGKVFDDLNMLAHAITRTCDTNTSDMINETIMEGFFSQSDWLSVAKIGETPKRMIEATRARLKNYPALRDKLLVNIGGMPGEKVQFSEVVIRPSPINIALPLRTPPITVRGVVASVGTMLETAATVFAKRAAPMVVLPAPASVRGAITTVGVVLGTADTPPGQAPLPVVAPLASGEEASKGVRAGSLTPQGIKEVLIGSDKIFPTIASLALAMDEACTGCSNALSVNSALGMFFGRNNPEALGRVLHQRIIMTTRRKLHDKPALRDHVLPQIGGKAGDVPEYPNVMKTDAIQPGMGDFLPSDEVIQKASTILRAADIPDDRIKLLLSDRQERESFQRVMIVITKREEHALAVRKVFERENLIELPKFAETDDGRATLRLTLGSLEKDSTQEIRRDVIGLLTGFFEIPEAEVVKLSMPEVRNALSNFIKASKPLSDRIKPEDAAFAETVFASPKRRAAVENVFHMLDGQATKVAL